jgi:hypothetical protein
MTATTALKRCTVVLLATLGLASAPVSQASAAESAVRVRGAVVTFTDPESHTETLRVRMSVADGRVVAKALRRHRPLDLHPCGAVRTGTGRNAPHAWHLRGTQLVEVSAEAYQGVPTFVDADLDYWLRLGTFCWVGAQPRSIRWIR